MRAVKLLGDPARNQRGAAAVEFALLLTPFLMVTFGIIELGSYGMVQQALLNRFTQEYDTPLFMARTAARPRPPFPYRPWFRMAAAR